LKPPFIHPLVHSFKASYISRSAPSNSHPTLNNSTPPLYSDLHIIEFIMDPSNPDEIDLSDEDFYNDSNDYGVAEDAAMAATMGFTSFGSSKPREEEEEDASSRPSKKRRLNQSLDNNDQQPTYTALRVQTKPYPDEISYSDDDEDFALDTTADADAELDSDAPRAPPQTRSQTQRTGTGNGSGRSTPSQAQSQLQSQLPPRPPAATTSTSTRGNRGGRGGNRGGRQAQPQGPGNPLWYVNYYDSSSNENPWEGMEKYKGLAPVGTWVPRYWDTVAASTAAGGDVGAAGEGEGDESLDLDVGEDVVLTAG
jgi:hypothetical protein